MILIEMLMINVFFEKKFDQINVYKSQLTICQ